MANEIILALGVLVFIWFWMVIAGVLAVMRDPTLESFQKWSQIALILLIPYFGAALVLHLVYQHSPESVPRALIPWPFKGLVFGKESSWYRNAARSEESGIDLAVSSRQDSGIGSSGGSDGAD